MCYLRYRPMTDVGISSALWPMQDWGIMCWPKSRHVRPLRWSRITGSTRTWSIGWKVWAAGTATWAVCMGIPCTWIRAAAAGFAWHICCAIVVVWAAECRCAVGCKMLGIDLNRMFPRGASGFLLSEKCKKMRINRVRLNVSCVDMMGITLYNRYNYLLKEYTYDITG